MGLFNTALGGYGVSRLAKNAPSDKDIALGFGSIFGLSTKDAIMSAGGLASDARKNLPGIVQNLENIANKPQGFTGKDKLMAALIGAGALGVGAIRVCRNVVEQCIRLIDHAIRGLELCA
jgi:hypothetical protein